MVTLNLTENEARLVRLAVSYLSSNVDDAVDAFDESIHEGDVVALREKLSN